MSAERAESESGPGAPAPRRRGWLEIRRRQLRNAPPPTAALFDLPFNDLIFRAHGVHREHFDPNGVQLSTLLSISSVPPPVATAP